jgi:hypothetical protein
MHELIKTLSYDKNSSRTAILEFATEANKEHRHPLPMPEIEKMVDSIVR